MEHPLPALRKTLRTNRQELIALLLAGRARIEGEITRLANTKGLGSSGNVREKGLQRVGAHYDTMARELDGWMAGMVSRTAGTFFGEARAKMGVKTSVTEYSKRHVQKYMAMFSPANASSLAGVHAQSRMKAADLTALRKTLVDTMREASLTGMTARQIQKGMKDRLEKAVDEGGGLPSWKFIDRGGRNWTSGNYLNMLTRTTTARVARESYTDALVDEGFDLATIEGGGNPCPICEAWRGRVVSLTGKTPGYPTLADAEADGVFHPNCVCEPQYADELADKAKLEEQKGMEPPDTGKDRDSEEEPERKPVDEVPPALEEGEPAPEPEEAPAPKERTPDEWEQIERDQDWAAEYRKTADRDLISARPDQVQKFLNESENLWNQAQEWYARHVEARLRGDSGAEADAEARYRGLMDRSAKKFEEHSAALAKWKRDEMLKAEGILFPGGKAHGGAVRILDAKLGRQNIESAEMGLDYLRKLLGAGAELDVQKLSVSSAAHYGGKRAYCDGDTVCFPAEGVKYSSPSVMIHEMGHALEHTDLQNTQRENELREPAPDGTVQHDTPVVVHCKEFLARRTAGESEVKLKEVFPDGGYEDNEVSRPDKFRHPYVGKSYEQDADEVLSMGLQWMMTEPAAFAREDPEHFNFTLRMVRLIARRRGATLPGKEPK